MKDAAIIGLGNWGRTLVSAFSGRDARLRISTAVTLDIDANRDFAARHHLRLTERLDDVLSDSNIAAVIVASPNVLHKDHVIAAARHGKHVFVEKPLALSPEDAVSAASACDAAGVGLVVGFNWRFHPGFLALRDLIAAGALGAVLHLEGNYSGNSARNRPAESWRLRRAENPAGAMSGRGIHVLNLMQALAGKVTSVYAFNDNRAALSEVPDTTAMLMRFGDGPSGYIGSCQVSAEYWRLHVTCDGGWAEMRGETDTELTWCRIGETPSVRRLETGSLEAAELEFFAQCVGSGDFPRQPLRDAVDAVGILAAIEKSAEQGAPVIL
jgi:predicted dehydrogenase